MPAFTLRSWSERVGLGAHLQVAASMFSSIIMMHIPRSSLPRRPARPLICAQWQGTPHTNQKTQFQGFSV